MNGRIAILIGIAVAATVGVQACRHGENPENPESINIQTMPTRDINEVLGEHDDALMAIPGVTGVYVGRREADSTPCLKVMVVKKTPGLVEQIPQSLDGYPVVIVESGEIRPLEEE